MLNSAVTTYEDDLDLLRSTAVAAGIIAAGYFRRSVKSWTKENASPVSEADMQVDRFLQASLKAARPSYGWLSEETADNADRLGRSRVFICDPIDGTRGFLEGDDSWTVSMAVTEGGRAVAGVVYAPARNELYEASLGGGARMNGFPLEREVLPGRMPIIPAGGLVHQQLQDGGLSYTRGPGYASVAYRLVQVATGELDAALGRRGAQDWDLAGAAIILGEAGIELEDVCVGALTFNKPNIRHGALVATHEPSLRPLLHKAMREVFGCPGDGADSEGETA